MSKIDAHLVEIPISKTVIHAASILSVGVRLSRLEIKPAINVSFGDPKNPTWNQAEFETDDEAEVARADVVLAWRAGLRALEVSGPTVYAPRAWGGEEPESFLIGVYTTLDAAKAAAVACFGIEPEPEWEVVRSEPDLPPACWVADLTDYWWVQIEHATLDETPERR